MSKLCEKCGNPLNEENACSKCTEETNETSADNESVNNSQETSISQKGSKPGKLRKVLSIIIVLTLLFSVVRFVKGNIEDNIRDEALEEIKNMTLDGYEHTLGKTIEAIGNVNNIDIDMEVSYSGFPDEICTFSVYYFNTDIDISDIGDDFTEYNCSTVSDIPLIEELNCVTKFNLDLAYNRKTKTFETDHISNSIYLEAIEPECCTVISNTYEVAEYFLRWICDDGIKHEGTNNSYNGNSNNAEYYSVIETTANGGVHFNMSLDEFIENYNRIINKEYTISKDDFYYGGSTNNLNNVEVEQYICTKTVFPNNKVGIVAYVEKDSNCISGVEVALSRDYYLSLSDDGYTDLTVQRMLVARALIKEIENLDDFLIIYNKQTENTEKYNEPSVWEKGVLFNYDTVDNTSLFQCFAYTKEQYEYYTKDTDMNK